MPAFLALLPLILQLLGIVLKWYGASDAMVSKYIKFVQDAQDDGLITVAVKDKLQAQRQAILDRQNSKLPPGSNA